MENKDKVVNVEEYNKKFAKFIELETDMMIMLQSEMEEYLSNKELLSRISGTDFTERETKSFAEHLKASHKKLFFTISAGIKKLEK